MRQIIVVISLALALVAFGSHGVRADSADPESADAAFKQAFQTGNIAELMALYAPDAVEATPFGTFHGQQEIHGFAEQFIRTNPGLSVSFSSTVTVLDTAVHRIAIASDPIRAAGVNRIIAIHTLVISQGKIIAVGAALDLSDPETARFAATMGGS